MIRIDLPEGHPAQFIIDDVKEKLTKLEAERGKQFLVQVTVAHSLFKLLELVEESNKEEAGDSSKSRHRRKVASRLFESAMCNLTHNLDKKGDELLLAAVQGLMHAEQAVNAVSHLTDLVPGTAGQELVDAIKEVAKQMRAAKAEQDAKKADEQKPAEEGQNAH